MNVRTLLIGSSLFTASHALADEPITPPVDTCCVTTNTKSGPMMAAEPAEPEVVANRSSVAVMSIRDEAQETDDAEPDTAREDEVTLAEVR